MPIDDSGVTEGRLKVDSEPRSDSPLNELCLSASFPCIPWFLFIFFFLFCVFRICSSSSVVKRRSTTEQEEQEEEDEKKNSGNGATECTEDHILGNRLLSGL
jgi:hypothetical protein